VKGLPFVRAPVQEERCTTLDPQGVASLYPALAVELPDLQQAAGFSISEVVVVGHCGNQVEHFAVTGRPQ